MVIEYRGKHHKPKLSIEHRLLIEIMKRIDAHERARLLKLWIDVRRSKKL